MEESLEIAPYIFFFFARAVLQWLSHLRYAMPKICKMPRISLLFIVGDRAKKSVTQLGNDRNVTDFHGIFANEF